MTDASFEGQPKGSSQIGLAVLMSTGKILEGSNTANLMDWHRIKIHRVVKCTVASEAAAMSFGFNRTFFAKKIFSEIIFGRNSACKDVEPIIPLALQLTARLGLSQDLSQSVGMAMDCTSLLKRLHLSDIDAEQEASHALPL